MSENKYDLFNNPMVDAARKSMTPEQIEEYKKWGENMYGKVDFTKEFGMSNNSMKASGQDIATYAYKAVRSGLDPFELKEMEIQALNDVMGNKWYEPLGFTEKDVPRSILQIAKDGPRKITRQERRRIEKMRKKLVQGKSVTN